MEFIRRSSDYALRSLVYMAGFPKENIFYVSSIAKQRDVSPQFLHKIFQRLTKLGILNSHRGIKGGFSFAKEPSKITAKEVLEIFQGPVIFNQCLAKEDTCDRSKVCSLKKKVGVLQEKFINSLSKITLKKLAQEENI